MKTKVYDKANWHLVNGMSLEIVLEHFSFFMNWANTNNLLSHEGKEILELGVDESISLHSRMFNDMGIKFMENFYDKFISAQKKDEAAMNNDLKMLT